jgi:hypothetical protein
LINDHASYTWATSPTTCKADCSGRTTTRRPNATLHVTRRKLRSIHRSRKHRPCLRRGSVVFDPHDEDERSIAPPLLTHPPIFSTRSQHIPCKPERTCTWSSDTLVPRLRGRVLLCRHRLSSLCAREKTNYIPSCPTRSTTCDANSLITLLRLVTRDTPSRKCRTKSSRLVLHRIPAPHSLDYQHTFSHLPFTFNVARLYMSFIVVGCPSGYNGKSHRRAGG